MGKTKSKVKKKKRRMDAARRVNEETIKQLKANKEIK